MNKPVCRVLAALAVTASTTLSLSAALDVAPGYHARTIYASAPGQLISSLEGAAAGVLIVDSSHVVSVSAEVASFSPDVPLVHVFPGSVPAGTDYSTLNLYGGKAFVGRGLSFSSPYPHALGVLHDGLYEEITTLDGLYDSATDADGLGIGLVANPGFAGSQLFRFQPTNNMLYSVGTMGGYSGGIAFEPAISGSLFYADQSLSRILRFSRSEVVAGGLTPADADVVVSNIGASYLSFDARNRLLAVTDYGNALRAYDPLTGRLQETVATDGIGGYGIGKVQGDVGKRRIALVFSDFGTYSSRIVLLQPYQVGLDYHGTRHAVPAVYNERQGKWRILGTDGTSVVERAFGGPGHKAVDGDFDGDRTADIATCNLRDGTYHFIRSSDQTYGTITPFTPSSGGTPAPGDFNADGLTDAGVLSGGTIRGQQNGLFPFSYSVPGGTSPRSMPACGDFDGDGQTDPCVYVPSSGQWSWYSVYRHTYITVPWGWHAAVPVPADYDGDGITDFAVYHPAAGRWYIQRSTDGQQSVHAFGSRLGAPVPGDFDGDGRADLSVYVELTGQWSIQGSTGITASFRLGGPGWKAVRP